MSWQTYVDDHLMCDIEGNHLTSTAILGHDGSFKPEEITGIMKDLDEPGFLAPIGLYLGGTKYMVIQGEPGAFDFMTLMALVTEGIELPLRMAGFGFLHRNEASGALSGLTISAKCFMNCEVSLIFEHKYKQLQQMSDDPMNQITLQISAVEELFTILLCCHYVATLMAIKEKKKAIQLFAEPNMRPHECMHIVNSTNYLLQGGQMIVLGKASDNRVEREFCGKELFYLSQYKASTIPSVYLVKFWYKRTILKPTF
ncbi:hypothetical protein CsSME_00016368 [Camellia sinensis var. sinensis]